VAQWWPIHESKRVDPDVCPGRNRGRLRKLGADYQAHYQIEFGLWHGSNPSVVLQALDELIAAGLAKAYRLSNQIEEIGGMPPPDEIGSPNESLTDDAYFWVTEDGRRLQLADCPAWPFDDNNTLRADWRLPEN